MLWITPVTAACVYLGVCLFILVRFPFFCRISSQGSIAIVSVGGKGRFAIIFCNVTKKVNAGS